MSHLTVDAPDVVTDKLVHLTAYPTPVTVTIDGVQVAATDAAIVLHEIGVPDRIYIPREDVDVSALRPIAGTTFCPFKGVASDYWAYGEDDAPVAWSYPEPVNAFEAIGGHIAFYDAPHIRIAA